MTASTSEFASASSKRGAVSTPSAAALVRAESSGSTPNNGVMTVLFDKFAVADPEGERSVGPPGGALNVTVTPLNGLLPSLTRT